MEILKNKYFTLHLAITLFAQAGSFFTIVAMPWLVLNISNNNPWIMSSVMAVGALPQALFMILGGVISDRFSAIRIIIISRLGILLLLATIAVCIKIDVISLPLIYFFAFSIGVLSAILTPSSQALLPAIVASNQLSIANALFIGSMQISQILGPLMAGWFIYWSKNIDGSTDANNLAYANAFLIEVIILLIVIPLSAFIRTNHKIIAANNPMKMLREGLSFCWNDLGIRLVLSYLILVSLFLNGTMMACLPIFIKIHLGLGEQIYGNLYAMIGIGTITGIAFSIIFKPSHKNLGMIVLLCDLINAICLIGLSQITHFNMAIPILLIMGACGGLVMSTGTTWFQLRTPGYLMGRVMSILLFCIYGLIPVSTAITGYLLLFYDSSFVMRMAGLFIVLITLIGFSFPTVRMMGNIKPIQIN